MRPPSLTNLLSTLFLAPLAIFFLITLPMSTAHAGNVGIAKEVQAPFQKLEGNTYRWQVFIRLQNLAEQVQVQLTDDIKNQFGNIPPENITISNVSLIEASLDLDGDGQIETNSITDLPLDPSFDGSAAHSTLFANYQTLPFGGYVIVHYEITVNFGNEPGPFNTTARVDYEDADRSNASFDISHAGIAAVDSGLIDDDDDVTTPPVPDTNPQDNNRPTTVFLPRTTAAPLTCSAGSAAKVNQIINGDFQSLNASTFEAVAGANIANSFRSDAGYAGDFLFASNGKFSLRGITEDRGNRDVIALFGAHTFQHPFPGDFTNNIIADEEKDGFLLSGGPIGGQNRIWYQKLKGLDPAASYVFSAYVSNAAWAGLEAQSGISLPDAQIQLMKDGELEGELLELIDDSDSDTWHLMQIEVTPEADGKMELAIANLNDQDTFFNTFAVANIGLRKCLTAQSKEDASSLDFDGVVQQPSDNSNPTGSNQPPASENATGGNGGGGALGLFWMLWIGSLLAFRQRLAAMS